MIGALVANLVVVGTEKEKLVVSVIEVAENSR